MTHPWQPRCEHCGTFLVVRRGLLVCPEPSCGIEVDRPPCPECDGVGSTVQRCDVTGQAIIDECPACEGDGFERAADCVSGRMKEQP